MGVRRHWFFFLLGRSFKSGRRRDEGGRMFGWWERVQQGRGLQLNSAGGCRRTKKIDGTRGEWLRPSTAGLYVCQLVRSLLSSFQNFHSAFVTNAAFHCACSFSFAHIPTVMMIDNDRRLQRQPAGRSGSGLARPQTLTLAEKKRHPTVIPRR